MDDEEGEGDLLFGFDGDKQGQGATATDQPKQDTNTGGGDGNLLDLNMMLGTTPTDNQNAIQNSGLLDLIGGGPPAQNNNMGGGLLDMGMGMPQQ